ncbi:hypothetical protein AO386_21640 [Pseudomonas syringae ICMP 11292]|nr:hypothetical protein AO386_21640 [Pseudomonas syringae ICMP 11292]
MCEAIVDCPHSTPVWTNSGFVVLRNQNIKGGRLDLSSPSYTDEKHFKQRVRRMAPRAGDIVITREAPMGDVCKIPEGLICCLGQRQVLLRPKAGVNPDYLLYALQSPSVQDQIRWNEGTGSTVSNIRIPVLEQIEIPRLGQAEEPVAAALKSVDDKIDVNRRINQTLEAMAQAIFKSWFVDFDPVKAKIAAIQEGCDPLRAAMSAISGKPDAELEALPPEQYEQLAATAAPFPDEMEESEQGVIPRGWNVSKVETLLARLPAKTRYTKDQILEYAKVPVFEQGASILLGHHNGAASYQACAENPMFIFGDHTCVTRLSCQPFDISQNVIPLQGKGRATAWVYYAVKEKQKFQEYRRHWMELISKDVVVAAADICLEFSKRVSNLHLQMEAHERQMQSLRELRGTLLPKLLSGELSVESLTEIAGGS